MRLFATGMLSLNEFSQTTLLNVTLISTCMSSNFRVGWSRQKPTTLNTHRAAIIRGCSTRTYMTLNTLGIACRIAGCFDSRRAA